MKTIPATRVREEWNFTDVDVPLSEVPKRARSRDAHQTRPHLLESEEYEWTTPLNLPGLIVAPSNIDDRLPQPAKSDRPTIGDVIESEEGDAISACQLPGGLGVTAFTTTTPAPIRRQLHELEEADEYSDRAAMQMPGGLIAVQCTVQEEGPIHAARGLCANCIHNATCDFPRPASGVWRCEEFA